MFELNRVELRALVASTGLLLLGAAARLGFGPGPAELAWIPDPSDGAERSATLAGARAAVAEGILAETRASTPLQPGERLDPNAAPPEELQRLPGIGPARADAIVMHRRRNGPFRTLDDLSRVPGLGPETIARLASFLSLAPPARFQPTPAPSAIDVNRAQIKELEQITGIGPVLARRIVETRDRLGGYRLPEDLLEVPGIGPHTLQKIQHRLRFR